LCSDRKNLMRMLLAICKGMGKLSPHP
jgi:hypothetical protein